MKSTRVRRAVAVAGAVVITASLAAASGEPVDRHRDPGDHRCRVDVAGHGVRRQPGTNTVVAEFTVGANSSTGWHSHPGKTLVTVQSGTFTVYHDNCHAHMYGPGDAFVELPSSVHVGRNETGETVKLGVVFFGVPIGGSPRIDQPQPDGCDVN